MEFKVPTAEQIEKMTAAEALEWLDNQLLSKVQGTREITNGIEAMVRKVSDAIQF